MLFDCFLLVGIISACAEQTAIMDRVPHLMRDHLRVCGADSSEIAARLGFTGSSPRVRSRHGRQLQGRKPLRIISACAEQTTSITVA